MTAAVLLGLSRVMCGHGTLAAMQRAIASHTSNTIGPVQRRSAGGKATGIHGGISRAINASGKALAPRRSASHTAPPAVAAIAAAANDTGNTAMRPLSVPVNATVPCDNHAAAETIAAAIRGKTRETRTVRARCDGRMMHSTCTILRKPSGQAGGAPYGRWWPRSALPYS